MMRKRSQVIHVLDTLVTTNQAEMRAVGDFFLRLKATDTQVTDGIRVMHFFARFKIATDYPEYHVPLKPHMDLMLQKACCILFSFYYYSPSYYYFKFCFYYYFNYYYYYPISIIIIITSHNSHYYYYYYY